MVSLMCGALPFMPSPPSTQTRNLESSAYRTASGKAWIELSPPEATGRDSLRYLHGLLDGSITIHRAHVKDRTVISFARAWPYRLAVIATTGLIRSAKTSA